MMNLFLKILVAILLLFNGIGALFGGGSLILHPDGSGIQLSLEWLQHSPFHDYLIPGIILFIANGLLSFAALAALIFSFRNYTGLVILQGAILTGWIVIQILIIRTVYFLHIIMGAVGISLLLLGWWLRKSQDQGTPSSRLPSGVE